MSVVAGAAPAWPLRRVMRWAAAVLAAAVVVAVIWAIVWATHYAPLGPGSMSGPLVGDGVVVEPVTASGGAPVEFMRDGYGRTVRVGMSVRNDGGTAVTLLGVDPGKSREGIFQVVGMTVGPHDLNEGRGLAGGLPSQFRTLSASHPALLRPGDDRLLHITIRLVGHCIGGKQAAAFGSKANGTSEWISTVPLRYRVWHLFTRTQDVAMPENLALVCSGAGIDGTPG